MNNALSFISNIVINNDCCKFINKDINSIYFSIQIPWLRKKVIKYNLVIEKVSEKELKVREGYDSHTLPLFCPQRHINYGGYFCLGVNDIDELYIYDEGTAKIWFDRLATYLRLQEKTNILKEWDKDKEWLHGDAAKYQKKALEHGKKLGLFFIKALNDKNIKISFRKINSIKFLFISFNNSSFRYTINLTTKKVARLSSSSFYNSGLKLGCCNNYYRNLYEFGIACRMMLKKEQEFWENWKKHGIECCETCKDCKFKKAIK